MIFNLKKYKLIFVFPLLILFLLFISTSFLPPVSATTPSSLYQTYYIEAEHYPNIASLLQNSSSYLIARDSLAASSNKSFYGLDWEYSKQLLAVGQRNGSGSDTNYWIWRTALTFDTSRIPIGATIVNASVSLWFTAKTYASSKWNLVVQGGQPLTEYPHYPAIQTDYNRWLYTGNYGGISYDAIITGKYSNFSVSDTIIMKGTLTKFMVRTDQEIAGAVPSTTGEVGWFSNSPPVNATDWGSYRPPVLRVTILVSNILYIDTSPHIGGKIYINSLYQADNSWQDAIEPGTYIISFSDVSNYRTPQPQTITLTVGEYKGVLGNYVYFAPPSPYVSSLTTLLVPGMVIGALAGSFYLLGDHMGEHGTGGFLIGGATGLILCTQSLIIPVWFTTIFFIVGLVGVYFWFRSK